MFREKLLAGRRILVTGGGTGMTGSRLLRNVADSKEGYYYSRGLMDGVHRIVSYRRVGDLLVPYAIRQRKFFGDMLDTIISAVA